MGMQQAQWQGQKAAIICSKYHSVEDLKQNVEGVFLFPKYSQLYRSPFG
jgi:hypothetical protein